MDAWERINDQIFTDYSDVVIVVVDVTVKVTILLEHTSATQSILIVENVATAKFIDDKYELTNRIWC